MEPIFKLGDHVYHWLFGWGKVMSVISRESEHPIRVMFNPITIDFTIDGKLGNEVVRTLSFTDYNFITGGFSQERPRPDLKPGTLIWVYSMDNWLYRRFMNWCNNNKVCTVGQNAKILDNNSCNDARLYSDTWSLECPISN